MNDLTVIDAAEQQRLKEMMGMETRSQSDRVPMVKINSDFEDDEGNELKPGTIFLRDHEPLAYTKEFKLRVLGQHYQYIEYNPEQNKTVCKTTINKSFGHEFLDTRGTRKCGMTKPKSKMEEYEKKRFENVTCFRQLRGLVSYEGQDKYGNTHVIENQPAILLLKGSNFMPFEEEVVKKMPKGSALWDYWLNVSLERRKNGSVVYYVMHYDFDSSQVQPFDAMTADTVKAFAAMVDRENDRILNAHKEAVAERSSGDYEVAEYDDLDSDLE
jgi:hypothetical protein